MAPGLRLWVGAAVAACLLIGAAYLPPRGGVRAGLSGVVFTSPRPVTAARLRAQALGAELRTATAHLRVTEARTQMGSEVERRSADARGVVLLIIGPDSLARRARPAVAAALDSVWQRLGLDEAKVTLVLVLDLVATLGSERTYVFPDSTDRTTCAVWESGGYWIRAGRPLPGGPNFGRARSTRRSGRPGGRCGDGWERGTSTSRCIPCGRPRTGPAAPNGCDTDRGAGGGTRSIDHLRRPSGVSAGGLRRAAPPCCEAPPPPTTRSRGSCRRTVAGGSGSP
jgi:hypothetical protein